MVGPPNRAVSSTSSSHKVIYAALLGDILVAITKLIAAVLTGSVAMLSEGVHSIVDTANEGVLLYGLHRAERPPDSAHPLGYGRELYFWSFIVALLIFSLGACVSFLEGIIRIFQPEPIKNVVISYIVLALSFTFELITWWIALKNFQRNKGGRGYLEAFKESKDPPSFIVLFEDSAAMIGLLIAFAGIVLAQTLNQPIFDGIASIGIGLLLATTATFLAKESKDLLIGEAADRGVIESILAVARKEPGIENANGLLTVHLAPNQIVAILSLEFQDNLTTTEIEHAVVEIERKVKLTQPAVSALFVKPQTASTFREPKEGEAFG
jgi:cation diffusion facilitator family transporter